MATSTLTPLAEAGEFIATAIAWNGSAGEGWIAATLARGGHDVDADKVIEFAVEADLLKPIPRLGGYTVAKRVNARTFGRKFAEWMAGE